jgi:hypothetical protein
MGVINSPSFDDLAVHMVCFLFMDTEVFKSLETARPKTFRNQDCGNAFRPSAGPHTNTMAPDDA